jgi:hypothetical protein
MQRLFDAVAQWSSRASGNACTFATAIVFVFAWGILGPLLHFSDPGHSSSIRWVRSSLFSWCFTTVRSITEQIQFVIIHDGCGTVDRL